MNKRERIFVETVWEHYTTSGRHHLPWRRTVRPYHILVSEIMLQQTQVDRVIPKYYEFLQRFPSMKQLAKAPLGEVLRAWQGLGYNRRAKFLHQTACEVTEKYRGRLPRTCEGLRALPGIGSYTAGAVMVFAHNEPTTLVETNVRQVFLHHFFKNEGAVSDTAIAALVAKTRPEREPRQWYWALMDYGAYLKQQYGNSNHKSKHYTKQLKFQGSDRQIRGAILKQLSAYDALAEHKLHADLAAFKSGRVAEQLARLVAEGMVQKTKSQLFLYGTIPTNYEKQYKSH